MAMAMAMAGAIFQVVLLLEVQLVLLDLLLDLFEVGQARQWIEDLGQTTRRTFIGHCFRGGASSTTNACCCG